MTVNKTKFTSQHIVLLLSITTSCLLNWPHQQYSVISTSSEGYTVHQILSLRSRLQFDYTIEMMTELMFKTQTSDMIFGSSGGMMHSAWQLIDGLRFCSQLPSRTCHSFCGSTDQHVRGLNLDHLIMYCMYSQTLSDVETFGSQTVESETRL